MMFSARTRPDAELVARCLGSDLAGWDEFYHNVVPVVALRLARICHDPELADEVVYDMASRLWENRHPLEAFVAGQGTLVAFLVGLARMRLSKELARRQKRVPARCAIPQVVDHRLIPEGLDARLDEFQAGLSRRQREYFQSHVLSVPREAQKKSFTSASARQFRFLLNHLWKAFVHGDCSRQS
jgi:DNA-directed RNA polymerase specialized sigma24 family protein